MVPGLPDSISSRDIVDGHMEKTLNLLWHIIFGFQVSQMLLFLLLVFLELPNVLKYQLAGNTK
jgi:hypothetical protein